jgi:hypothetical protein
MAVLSVSAVILLNYCGFRSGFCCFFCNIQVVCDSALSFGFHCGLCGFCVIKCSFCRASRGFHGALRGFRNGFCDFCVFLRDLRGGLVWVRGDLCGFLGAVVLCYFRGGLV